MTTTTTSGSRESLSAMSSRAWVGAGLSGEFGGAGKAEFELYGVGGGGCFDVSADQGAGMDMNVAEPKQG